MKLYWTLAIKITIQIIAAIDKKNCNIHAT